jgi:nucleoside 2-deoxyribosyltransferase
MFSLLGDQNLKLLTSGFQADRQGSDILVSSKKGEICVSIDTATYPYQVKHTTMKWSCGHGTSCFDHLAASPSDCQPCHLADECPGARFLPYMPEIYVASTFEPFVRDNNVKLKEALHDIGLMATLPQHLSVGNPKRSVQGGTLAEDPETRGGELATLGGRWCEAVMRRCDGAVIVINRMKQDSSWETGFLHALKIPLIAVFYDDHEQDALGDFAKNWMVRLTDFRAIVQFPSEAALRELIRFRTDIHLRKQAGKSSSG